MLEHLIEYARKTTLGAEAGFCSKTVKWAIACDGHGRFLGLLPLGEGQGRVFPKCPVTPGMNAGGRSHFLAETLGTVTLWHKNDATAKEIERAEAKQRFFLDLLDAAGDVVPGLAAAARMLRDPGEQARIHAEAERKQAKHMDNATLYVDSQMPLDSDLWHSWWRERRLSLGGRSAGTDRPKVRDFLTGLGIAPTDTHPPIKGLVSVGGRAESLLVSFDKDAFRSFGLKQSVNAAMAEETAAAYASALNDLIAHHGVRLAGTLAVHWFKEQVADEDDPLAGLVDPSALEAPAQGQARRFLTAVKTGDRPSLGGNRYYALLLSGAGGRVMVRDWMEGAFQDLARNVDAWFDHLDMVGRDGGPTRPPKFLAVAGALVRDLGDLPPPLLLALWRAALGGGAIPFAALARALHRTRTDLATDQAPNPTRMGLMRAYHIRKGVIPMERAFNAEHPSPAYHCGRLLAVLASLQRAALGDVGAGVVQRYYTAASQAPALLIGRLVANAKNHLNKLNSPGLAFWYEERIAEVMSRIGDAPPRTLTLEQQSLFALGYYQQLAALRTKAPAAEAAESPDNQAND